MGRPIERKVRQPEQEAAGRELCAILSVRYARDSARFYAEYVLREEWDVLGTDKTRKVMAYGKARLQVLAEIVLD